MNVDFFSFLQDSDTSQPSSASLHRSSRSPHMLPSRDDGATPFSSSVVSSTYALYSRVPRERHTRERDYAPVYVSPSVIPTYLPGIRVWEYNASGEAKGEMRRLIGEEQDTDDDEGEGEGEGGSGSWLDRVRAWVRGRRGGGGQGKRGKEGKGPRRPPRPPRHSSPHAPARTNTYLTPLAYAQYYLSLDALEEANAAAAVGNSSAPPTPPSWELMYTTLSTTELARRLSATTGEGGGGGDDALFPSPLLPAPVRSLLSTPATPSRTHRLRRMLHALNLTPYDGVLSSGEGLTVRALLRVARWVTSDDGGRRGKRWEAFRWRMGVGSGEL